MAGDLHQLLTLALEPSLGSVSLSTVSDTDSSQRRDRQRRCRRTRVRTPVPQAVSELDLSGAVDTTCRMDALVTPSATTVGRRLGYARVSTEAQDEALQVRALEAAGVDALFIDHGVSGTATSRPRFDAMLADLRPGDSVVVYSLSRLSRGMKHLVELGERFEEGGIGLVSLTESIDTSTAMGRFVYTMLAALAAMERDLLAERTRAGLAAARAAGRVGGRPPKLTAEQRRHAQLLKAGGVSVDEIAASLGASRATVYRALRGEAAEV